MRVVVAGNQPAMWTQPLTHINEKSQVLQWLKDDAVVSMTEDDWGQVRAQLATRIQSSENDQTFSRLMEILQTVPMSGRIDQPPVDAYLDNLTPIAGVSQLGLAAADEELANLLRQRRSALDEARSRSAIYNLAIRPFASTARKVRLLDPYAAHGISRQFEGISWLLTQLCDDGIGEIEILSRRDDDHSKGVDEYRLAEFWKSHSRPGVKFRLIIADPIGDAHDRHLRFFYRDGKRNTPIVALGKGASVFDQERNLTPPTITDDSFNPRAVATREDAILQSRSRKSVYLWPLDGEPKARRGPADFPRP